MFMFCCVSVFVMGLLFLVFPEGIKNMIFANILEKVRVGFHVSFCYAYVMFVPLLVVLCICYMGAKIVCT